MLALEKVAEILGREVVPVGESDEKEVDLGTSGHLLEHGHELAAVDPPTLRRQFHRIKLLLNQNIIGPLSLYIYNF